MNSGTIKRRNRISLSCNLCKKRKVKCNRHHPCSACVKTNIAAQCTYNDSQEKIDEFNDASVLTSTFSVKKSYNGKITKPGDTNTVVPEVQSELNMLKNKIREIEANLKPNQLSASETNTPKLNDNSQSNQFYSSSERTPISLNFPLTPQGPPISTTQSNFPPIWMNHLNNSSGSINGSFLTTSLPSLNWPQNNTPIEVHDNLSDSKRDIYKFNVYTNLKFSGINPYGNEDDTINFYDGYSSIHIRDMSRRLNHGPFSWLVITKRDIYLRKLWLYVRSRKKKQKEHMWPLVKPVAAAAPEVIVSEVKFRKKAIDQEEGDCRLYKDKARERELLYSSEERMEIKSRMNKQTLSLGLTLYEGKMDKELELIEKVEIILPKKRVVWTLINKFFLTLYPFIPFIDEITFKSEMVRMLGPEDYTEENFKGLKIEKKIDFGYIGILLIMLRLSYLSIFSNKKQLNDDILKNNDPSPKLQELNYLLSNPVNLDVIDLAQLCLNQFELFRKSNLIVFQFAVLMRLYHMLSPEDGNGIDGGDTQIFGGLLIQMAYTLGFNREPDNFNEVQSDEKTNNLCRKIWYYLMKDDLLHACQLGAPFNIELKYFDTKIPVYKEGNENIVDVEMEKAILKMFHSFVDYYIRMRQILELALDIRSVIKLKEFTSMISDFENYISKIFGSIKDYLTPFDPQTFVYPFRKIAKFKSLIEIRSFLLTIYCHIFLYYEERDNLWLAFFYIKKLFAVCCTEFIPECFKMLLDNLENFGEGADLMLNSTLILMLQRTNQFTFTILARVNETIHQMKTTEQQEVNVNMVKLCKLSRLVQKNIEYCICTVSRLSNRYYHAWRVTKAHSHILGTLIGEEFYAEQSEKHKNLFSQISNEDLDEIISIFEYAESKMDPRRNAKNDTKDENINEQNKETSSPSQEFNIDIVDNAEIDKLWIQIATMKNKKFKGMKIPQTTKSKPLIDDQDIMGKNVTSYNSLTSSMSNSVINPLITTNAPSSNMDMDLNGFMLDLQEAYPFDFLSNFQVDDYLDSNLAE